MLIMVCWNEFISVVLLMSYYLEIHRFHPWVGKIPWRREWLTIPIFLPGESHGQRSLVGYHPPHHKESDMTKTT